MSFETPRPLHPPAVPIAPLPAREVPAAPSLPPDTLQSGRTGEPACTGDPNVELSIARQGEDTAAAHTIASHGGSALMQLCRQMAGGDRVSQPVPEPEPEAGTVPTIAPAAEPLTTDSPADPPAPETANDGGDPPVPPEDGEKPIPGPEEPEPPKSAFQEKLEQALDIVWRADRRLGGAISEALVERDPLLQFDPAINQLATQDDLPESGDELRAETEIRLGGQQDALDTAGLQLHPNPFNPTLQITDGKRFSEALATIPTESAGESLRQGLDLIARRTAGDIEYLYPEPLYGDPDLSAIAEAARNMVQDKILPTRAQELSETDAWSEPGGDHEDLSAAFDLRVSEVLPGDELPPSVEQVLQHGPAMARQLERLGVDPQFTARLRRAHVAHQEGVLAQYVKAEQLGLFRSPTASGGDPHLRWTTWNGHPSIPRTQQEDAIMGQDDIVDAHTAREWRQFDTLVDELTVFAPPGSAVIRGLAETFSDNVEKFIAVELEADLADFETAGLLPEELQAERAFTERRIASLRRAQARLRALLDR